MQTNGELNRKLRMALVGGGQGAFIQRVHATAAVLDNRAKSVAGPQVSDAESAKASAPTTAELVGSAWLSDPDSAKASAPDHDTSEENGSTSDDNRNAFPKLHNAMWPGLVGKRVDEGDEPPVDVERMLALEAAAEVTNGIHGIDKYGFIPIVEEGIAYTNSPDFLPQNLASPYLGRLTRHQYFEWKINYARNNKFTLQFTNWTYREFTVPEFGCRFGVFGDAWHMRAIRIPIMVVRYRAVDVTGARRRQLQRWLLEEIHLVSGRASQDGIPFVSALRDRDRFGGSGCRGARSGPCISSQRTALCAMGA